MYSWRLFHPGRLARPALLSSTLFRTTIAIFFVSILGGPAVVSRAADEPQPDPAGIATGDKTNVVDVGGNTFVVAEPTDKTDPDYAKKKADFDTYQDQATKEPLAVKLADDVG